MAIAHLAPAARPRSAAIAHATARLAHIDNLRVLLIALVVAHHMGQAYGPTGGAWPIFNPTRAAILGPFFTVNASFFMGLFFLISGYFVPAAYDRKGARAFLKDRLVRLGVPLLVVSLVLFLPFAYATQGQGQPFGLFLVNYLLRPEVGPLWFLSMLLVYTCGYAMWRWLTARYTPASPRLSAGLSHAAILGYALALAVVTFLVRIVFPVDRWVDLAPFIHIEPAHVPQYLSLFILGIVAYRRDWLRQLPTRTGMIWLAIGLTAAALPYVTTLLREFTPISIGVSSAGGLSLQALVWSMIEALLCAGLCIGLLTLFRERVNEEGPLARQLAASSFAVYIIHLFPVLGLQFALAESSLPPLAKFGLGTLIAVPLCFLLAYGLRKLPGVARVV